MIKPTAIALTTLWWRLHPGVRGLFLAAILGVGTLGFLSIPIGAPERFTGVVDHLGWGIYKNGITYPTAYVRLADRRVWVKLSDAHSCAVGSSINVVQQQHLWGIGFYTEEPSCSPRPYKPKAAKSS